MKRKQTIIMILCLLLSISAPACASNERKAQYSAEKEHLSFDEAINRSYCIVTAALKEIIENDDDREYLFSLERTLKGNMDADHFYVTEGYKKLMQKR